MPLANFWGRESHLLPQLNDAAACSDKGLFLYLPVKKDEEQLKAGCVTFGSIVSRLIFIPHMWSEAEKAEFPAQNLTVVPIHLITRDKSVSSLSWPVQTFAKVALYYSEDNLRLLWMQD
ncbi:hypothetical protein MMC21_007116 [Puttea exsequens]|nr:hypothetical protein [Puttea exsequens]